jgi:hypothetical protein
LAQDADFVRAAVKALVQAALEAEMTEAIGAAKGERSETRIAYPAFAPTSDFQLRAWRAFQMDELQITYGLSGAGELHQVA